MTIQVKATEQYFPVVLFIMLYKVVLTFGSVIKPLLLLFVIIYFNQKIQVPRFAWPQLATILDVNINKSSALILAWS